MEYSIQYRQYYGLSIVAFLSLRLVCDSRHDAESIVTDSLPLPIKWVLFAVLLILLLTSLLPFLSPFPFSHSREFLPTLMFLSIPLATGISGFTNFPSNHGPGRTELSVKSSRRTNVDRPVARLDFATSSACPVFPFPYIFIFFLFLANLKLSYDSITLRRFNFGNFYLPRTHSRIWFHGCIENDIKRNREKSTNLLCDYSIWMRLK